MINCTFEDGNKANPGLRHVTVNALAVNNANEILLVKRAAHLSNPHLWATPGGFLDRDETIEQAVLRELKEESGFAGIVEGLFQIIDNPNRSKEDRQNVNLTYIVRITGGEKTLNDEVEDIQWFSKTSLPEESECAFDHRDTVVLYFDCLENPVKLPIITSK